MEVELLSEVDLAPDYFCEIVEPTVAEFLDDRSSKRRGCLAALAIASMTVDYYHAHPTGSVSSFKGMLRAENAAVGFIADIANATKHVERTKTRLGYEDVQTLQLGTFGTRRAGWPFAGVELLWARIRHGGSGVRSSASRQSRSGWQYPAGSVQVFGMA